MAKRAVPVRPTVETPDADLRRRLIAMRDLLTERLSEAAARDTAPIASRLQAVLTQLAAIPEATEASTLDDLAARRASRRSAASGL